MIILAGIKPLEERLQQRHKSHEISVETEKGELSIAAFDTALGYRARRISRSIAAPSETEGFENIAITLTRLSPKDVEEIVRDLAKLPGVKRVERRP